MTCPTPEKTKFTSERVAKRGLRALKHPHGVMHAYRCGGHWHIGHRNTFIDKDKPARRKRGRAKGRRRG